MIRTFDNKTEVTFDIEGLGKYLKGCIEQREEITNIEKAKLESYCNGYRDAIYEVAKTMGYMNYRAKETEKVGD